jgi:hypothetical protein
MAGADTTYGAVAIRGHADVTVTAVEVGDRDRQVAVLAAFQGYQSVAHSENSAEPE